MSFQVFSATIVGGLDALSTTVQLWHPHFRVLYEVVQQFLAQSVATEFLGFDAVLVYTKVGEELLHGSHHFRLDSHLVPFHFLARIFARPNKNYLKMMANRRRGVRRISGQRGGPVFENRDIRAMVKALSAKCQCEHLTALRPTDPDRRTGRCSVGPRRRDGRSEAAGPPVIV